MARTHRCRRDPCLCLSREARLSANIAPRLLPRPLGLMLAVTHSIDTPYVFTDGKCLLISAAAGTVLATAVSLPLAAVGCTIAAALKFRCSSRLTSCAGFLHTNRTSSRFSRATPTAISSPCSSVATTASPTPLPDAARTPRSTACRC